MNNPINRVLSLAADGNNIPQCPVGAESIWDHASNQGPAKPMLWLVYGPDNAWNATLWEQEPGTYCIQADAGIMSLIDPGSAGVELSKYTGNWRWGSMDGEEDDPENPGQKRAVVDRMKDIGLGKKPPTPIPQAPVVIDAAKGLVATAFRPCVPGSVAGAGVDLRLQSMNMLPNKVAEVDNRMSNNGRF